MEKKKVSAAMFIPILIAFMCMGFGDAAGPLADLVKGEGIKATPVQSSLVTFMGFIMFGILSIPLGLFQDRKGKKTVLILGLMSALVGMLAPSIGIVLTALGMEVPAFLTVKSYYMILFAIFFLGSANAILQVSGNPIMRDVSEEGKYSRNLTIGQFVKAIGTLSAVLIPIYAIHLPFIKKHFADSSFVALFPIYLIGILITVFLVAPLKVEEKKEDNASPASWGSCLSLLGNKYVLMMVLAIFFYVGAEVCVFSNIGSYFKDTFGMDLETKGMFGTLFVMISILAGRFSGSVILNWLSPKTFLIITCILSLAGIGGLYIGIENIGWISAFMIGLGFANIFPLIFSIAVDHMPERTNELSGLMVTAIVGGAFVPMLFGLAYENTANILIGFLVPLTCVLYITVVGLLNMKITN
jgi:fucose permease